MATSSIFSNVKITDVKNAEAFVHALELSEKESAKKTANTVKTPLTDIEAIRKLAAKRNSKK